MHLYLLSSLDLKLNSCLRSSFWVGMFEKMKKSVVKDIHTVYSTVPLSSFLLLIVMGYPMRLLSKIKQRRGNFMSLNKQLVKPMIAADTVL